MPHLEIPHFVLKPIIDTVFVVAQADPKTFWETYGAVLVGVFVAMIGWAANSWFTRRNQLKAFKEQTLDKIRVELNVDIAVYRDWLKDCRKKLRTIKPEEDIGNHKLFNEFISIEAADNIYWINWYVKLQEHIFLFPKLEPIILGLVNNNKTLLGFCGLIIKGDAFQEDLNTFKAFWIEHSLQQTSLINEFFQVFQYECLKNIAESKPKSFRNDKFDYISSDARGNYIIVPVRKPEFFKGVKLREKFEGH